jgi:hypothetical protein
MPRQLWDLAMGKTLAEFEPHGAAVTALECVARSASRGSAAAAARQAQSAPDCCAPVAQLPPAGVPSGDGVGGPHRAHLGPRDLGARGAKCGAAAAVAVGRQAHAHAS